MKSKCLVGFIALFRVSMSVLRKELVAKKYQKVVKNKKNSIFALG